MARRVTPALVESASLVLTADGGHRAALLKDSPLAFRRTFTLREFARLGAGRPLLDGPSTEALVERVREVAAARGRCRRPLSRVPTTSATRSVPRWTSCARPAPRSARPSNGAIAALGLGR